MFEFLLSFGGVLVWWASEHWHVFEIMLGRRGGSLPFEAGSVAWIWGSLLAVFQRPDQIEKRQQICDAENGSAGAGKDVVNLKFAGICMVTPWHAEVAHDELGE